MVYGEGVGEGGGVEGGAAKVEAEEFYGGDGVSVEREFNRSGDVLGVLGGFEVRDGEVLGDGDVALGLDGLEI